MILCMMLLPRLVIFLLISFYDGTLAARRKQATPAYRLPDTVVPRKYTLEIFTNLEEDHFEYNGKVLIKIQCMKATNKIVLHANDLEIVEEKVTLRHVSTVNTTVHIPITAHSYSKENSFYIVTLEEKLVPGSIYLYYIPFKGKLKEGLTGYYRSSYLDKSSNQTKWLAVTQFEPTDARRAFPCFDEPAMKATFAISLGHDENFKAVSNMPLRESKPLSKKSTWVLDKFEETVPMSTYLVAFMVSDFESSEASKQDSNVTFRLWARKEAIHQVEVAQEVGPKCLAYFSKYFNVEYPLPKQDMAAIPDFDAGAMENWGFITYREIALLYDPKSSSILNKHSIAYTICHELAHQWFGNLVTMKWWTDLWLNEGFATYVGFLGVDHVFPEWKALNAASISDLLTVFTLDALSTSHPVSVPIGHPSEIEQIFDTISYKKGSYLIRMMNMFLGEDVFQRSVTNYLIKHKYGNADQDDLWDALTQEAHAVGVLPSNITVKMIMDTWTVQTGYPLVTVTRDYQKKTVTVRQNRYMSLAADAKKDAGTEDSCWWIPLSYTTSKEWKFDDTRPKMWLTCDGPITFESDLTENDWILFNIKIAGLFRVDYDTENWRLLESSLADANLFSTIDPLNRVQIIADVLGLAWIGKLEYPTAFNMIQYLQHEPEYLSWYTAFSSLKDVREMLRRTPIYGYFKRFIRHIMEPSYRKLNSITDIPDDFEGIKMHTLIVSWSCSSGVGDCEEQTQSLFKAWYNEPNPDENNPIPKDLRSVVYCHALKMVGEKYWEFLWERYQRSNVATEKQQILSSLGCVRELWLLQRYLTWSINSTKVRLQDSTSVFSSVSSNEIGYSIAKNFFMKNFQEIRQYHETKSSRMGDYVSLLLHQITSEEELEEFQSFLESKKPQLKESEISIKQGIETAYNNIAWHEMHYDELSNYFENH